MGNDSVERSSNHTAFAETRVTSKTELLIVTQILTL